MSQFPALRTGAVLQYPAARAIEYATGVLRFVDGKEQRSRSAAAPLRRWTISLHLVDEGELAALAAFFDEQQGEAGTFSFTDPWDGTVYPNCSIDQDELRTALEGPGSGRSQIVVRENRS
jgi:hypothetical protein